jgi:hypothetical protein
VAAFAFLGMVLWIYKWFRPEGAIDAPTLVREMQDLFFGSLQASLPPPPRKPARAGVKRKHT